MIEQLTFVHDLLQINGGKCGNFQEDVLLRHHWKLVILEKYHLEYIVIIPLKEQVEMVDTSATL